MNSRTFPKFSRLEFWRRSRKLNQMMEEESVNVAIIYGSYGNVAHLYYWTHYLARSSSYFVTNLDGSSKELFVGTYNHIPTAREMSVVSEISWLGRSSAETILSATKKILGSEKDQVRRKIVGLIGNSLPYDIVSALESRLGVKTVNLTPKANLIRAIKSKEEIEWLRKGADLTDRGMTALEEELREGMTEHQISDIVERACVPLGGGTRIHYIGSTSMQNPEIYVPSQYQTRRRLRKGDIVLTELSAEYGGYAGQLHRPIAIGTKPTENYAMLYDVSLEAYEDMFSVLRDGATSEDLIKAADRAIVRKGYTICDSLAHGFGTDLTFPELGTSNSVYPKSKYEFRENMAIVIQPNPITLDKKFGLQLGNLCLVGKKRSESLQKFPLKFVVIHG